MQDSTNSITVSEALSIAKQQLEGIVVTIVGEISEFSNKAGYKAVYFTIKDERSSLPCMIWQNRYHACGIELKVGDLVSISGRFSLYAAKGRMNFDVFSITLAGEGKLRLQVAQLAKKLEAEGLMSPERKRPIPKTPKKIGLVTSPRGAAVHDVLRTLRRRYPVATIFLAGVPVEGKDAPRYLIEGLKAVQESDVDVILLVRGGGSFEDLMPFNDENLARTIAVSEIPIITGIGHEPDTSIADMVADLRASTPTAAAEASAIDLSSIFTSVQNMEYRLNNSVERIIENFGNRIKSLETRPVLLNPLNLFKNEALALDDLSRRLFESINNDLDKKNNQLLLNASRLEDLSPLKILARGYSIAKNDEGTIVKRINQVNVSDTIKVTVSDGIITCDIQEKEKIEIDICNY